MFQDEISSILNPHDNDYSILTIQKMLKEGRASEVFHQLGHGYQLVYQKIEIIQQNSGESPG